MAFNAKRFGRRLVKGAKRAKKIIGSTAKQAKTILGKIDKVSGGALSSALMSDPRGRSALMGLDAADSLNQW
jgi:hypothetical protein